MTKNRLLELDAIRGIAAMAVVIFHYFWRFDDEYGHEGMLVDWSFCGRYGVQLFFMVSGFVIFWSLNNIKKPQDFVVSRFTRLYPVYWVCSILTFTVIYCCGLPGRQIAVSQAIANGLMFHDYIGVRYIDGVYWTLTVELTFYVWMFLIYFTKLMKYAEHILFTAVIISCLEALGFITVSEIGKQLLMAHYSSYFVAGICIFKLTTEKFNKGTGIILILCLLSTFITFSLSLSLWSCAFYLFLYFAVSGKLKFLQSKPLLFLGGISYALYLIHQNVGYVIIREFYARDINPYLGMAYATAVSIFLAYLATKYIEQPIIKAVRNFRLRARQNKDKQNRGSHPVSLSGNK